MDRTYLCIDLKSFYASVECVTRGLDPLTTNLVVADVGRTEKTICLTVTPSLKAYGIPGRARLFEVISSIQIDMRICTTAEAQTPNFERDFYMVSLDMEINPRFYRRKKKERSNKKAVRAWCEPKDFKKEKPLVK